MKLKISLKHDKFKNARGKYSRLLELFCRKCASPILLYQKDGSGSLLRIYFDRIIQPLSLSGLEKKKNSVIKTLKCQKCGEIIGEPYIYPLEKRKAFRLYQDAVTKKIRKLK